MEQAAAPMAMVIGLGTLAAILIFLGAMIAFERVGGREPEHGWLLDEDRLSR
ncbi:hypothetical protein ACFFSY_25150 [Paenibacillus aurantiacus]|uniref:Uncharacterized protein n=1 Tax=Paenibacillus aurantiacus TaxID=1936118 RepID=A0ABV5KVH8_9BACL